MAKFPTRLQIGPHRYTVSRRYKDVADMERRWDGPMRGEHLAEDLRITVNPGMALDAQAETLLHETLHACYHLHRLDKFPELSEHEEQFVVLLAPVLLDTLRRNPKLVAYLLDPE